MRLNRERTLHDVHISFQPTGTCARAPVSPSRARVFENNSSKTYPMDVLHHNFIRLDLTRTKALQTAIRFSRETRRCSAVPKSNAFTLYTYVMVPRDAFRPSKKAKTCTFMGRNRWRISRFCKEIINHIDGLLDAHLRFSSDKKFCV